MDLAERRRLVWELFAQGAYSEAARAVGVSDDLELGYAQGLALKLLGDYPAAEAVFKGLAGTPTATSSTTRMRMLKNMASLQLKLLASGKPEEQGHDSDQQTAAN